MSPRRIALAAAGVAVAFAVAYRESARSLWLGARYTVADRNRAMQKGLEFLYATARRPEVFLEFGDDLLSAFENIASTSGDRETSDLAWRMGHERALEWRRLFHEVPANATADDIANLVYGSDAAELLGAPDQRFREVLRRAAPRFPAAAYLGFDPAREPPPAKNRYPIFQDALIATYTGDQYGVPLGARYREVLRWLPAMHPYPARPAGHDGDYEAFFTVTHIVYTYNSYNRYRISPACFPQEFAYLKANLPQALHGRDPEVLGEFLDSLQAFGLTWSDPDIRQGVEILLSTQNPDGSWGDPREKDIYTRYHSTWTGMNGIQDFRWTRVLPCPVAPAGKTAGATVFDTAPTVH